MRGQGAGPGWGRHGQQPQPPPVHSAGRNEAPHPKVVVKAGSQNEALGWEAEAHGGCWKENEPRGSAGWPVPLVLLGEGSTPPTGRGGSAQTAVVSAHQAGRGWASTCPHPRPCRNEPGPSGPSLQGGCSAPQPALPGPQTLHLYRELAPRRYPVPHKTSPKGPQASQPDLRGPWIWTRGSFPVMPPPTPTRGPPAAPLPEDTAGPPAASVPSQGRLLPEQNLTPRGRLGAPPPTLLGAQVSTPPRPPRPPSQPGMTPRVRSPQAQSRPRGTMGS